MAWPLTPYQTFDANATNIGANFLNAIQTAINEIYPRLDYMHWQDHFDWITNRTGVLAGTLLIENQRWTCDLSDADSRLEIGTDPESRRCLIVIPGLSAVTPDVAKLYTRRALFMPSTTAFMEFEYDFSMSAIGANNVTWEIGFWDGGTSEATFLKRSVDTNWQAYTSNTGHSTMTSLGVPPVVDTRQRLKACSYGSALPGGARIEFYIDNVLCSTETIDMPNNAMCFYIRGACTGAVTSHGHFGPLRIRWTR